MSSVTLTAPVQRAFAELPAKSPFRPKKFFALLGLSVEAGLTMGLVIQSLMH